MIRSERIALYCTGRLTVALAFVTLVSACAGPSGSQDESLGRFLVAPGKYTLYTCEDLAIQARSSAARMRELESLIARAGTDAGGQFVSAIAYRSELTEKRGELNEMRSAAVAKNCKNIVEIESGGARASDGVIK